MEIWYNPRCSKCRIAKEAVESAGVEFNLRLYLEDAPSEPELRDVITRAGLEPWEICRTGDASGLGVTLPVKDAAHRDEWVAVMLANPPLIQRPIVIADDGSAYIARDEDSVAAAIDHSR
jgi:arsenate reductase